MKLKRLAQSTILLTASNGKTLLVDPGKYNLDPGKLTLESFPAADILIITHKHADHFDLQLLKAMLSRSKPTIITNEELGPVLSKEGISATIFKQGDITSINAFKIEAILADHVVRGELIINFGLVITGDGTSIYHTSDTRFMEPSQLPASTRAEYLLLPISNRGVVMGIDDAAVFASELKPKLVVPLHYDSPKDQGRVDPNEFVTKSAKLGVPAKILAFGEEIIL